MSNNEKNSSEEIVKINPEKHLENNVSDSLKDKEVVTINMQPLLMPIALILSSIIISSGLFAGLNNIGTNLKAFPNNVLGASTQQTSSASTTAATTSSSTSTTAAQPTVALSQIKDLFNNGNNIKFGDSNSKVLFVEFSDPSCPYCHLAAGKNIDLNRQLVKQLGDQFKLVQDGGTYVPAVPEIRKLVDAGKASFVWIYLNGHTAGELSTRALYCAYEQGKFWDVHDLLMSSAGYDLQNNNIHNDTTKYQVLADFLKSAMDPVQMMTCLKSGKYDSRITSDIALAKTFASFGVNGTPGFFVNTTNYGGAFSYKDMETTVNQALNS